MKKIAALSLVALPLLFVLISYSAAQVPISPRPDFIINADKDTIVGQPGQTVKYDLWLTPVNGFKGTVELSCTPSTPKINCQLPTQTVRLGASLAVAFSVTAAADGDAGFGAYPIVVNGKGTYGANLRSGSVSHDMMLHLALVPKGVD